MIVVSDVWVMEGRNPEVGMAVPYSYKARRHLQGVFNLHASIGTNAQGPALLSSWAALLCQPRSEDRTTNLSLEKPTLYQLS